MHPMLNIAVKAARRAGAIINRASQDIGTLTIKSKNFNDFVSEVDVAAERAIIDTLKDAYPSHGFLGEESGSTSHQSDFIWIIDPLDAPQISYITFHSIVYRLLCNIKVRSRKRSFTNRIEMIYTRRLRVVARS